MIKFNQNTCLKLYIGINADLRKKAQNDFEKDFFNLINNSDFGKTMEKVRKHRDVKLVTTERRGNYLLSEQPNHHTTKFFTEHLLAEKNPEILMNKPVYLGLSILELCKILMFEFWYDYVKPRYDEKAKLCYMNTDSFIAHLKMEIFFTFGIGTDILVNVLEDYITGYSL